MKGCNHIYVKVVILFLFIILIYYHLPLQTNYYVLKNSFKLVHQIFNRSQTVEVFIPISTNSTILNQTIINNIINTTTTAKHPITTMSTNSELPTTIDLVDYLIERPPSTSRSKKKTSKGTLAIFVFQTKHHVLANLQLYLIRKLAIGLVAIELFVDSSLTQDMYNISLIHKANLHVFPSEKHKYNDTPSERNTNVVNWAISTRAKHYLGNGTAILLLDGDVLPLSPFDSTALLNSHDIVCRKHPVLFARYCWIGFICLAPELYGIIDDFDVSLTKRHGIVYDSGGKTIEFLLKYKNTSFSWMKETIFLETDKNLFWGVVDNDIQWIKQHFFRCDKCGAEVFFSPFNGSNAVFYHMISATSNWRFNFQDPRRQSLYDSIMQSPYGPNQIYSTSDMIASIKKVQEMQLIPFFGNLTCEQACGS
ncbi:unnamed protein product [Adineta steineri]|uniref:Uncharacterized protein n=1 Tax=Adineta steineri TaxID=433720 RepID=A0A813PBP0_9BILA|nr:unnamed protein product [Adineta steineri]CAF3958903.1 unnamed protein product [Adineta steineri]